MNQPPYLPAQMQPAPKKSGLSVGCIIGIVVAVVGVVGVAVFALLAVYGTRKYIASAKAAEAKNSIGAIAREADAAFERESETGKHVLCKSATPVPSSPAAVRGTKYQPSPASGSDYNTGSETAGWICLKFSMTSPQYYQYHYNAGGGYVTPNGATAGTNGFEAAAVGDLDGDGVTSKFSRTGKVDASGDTMTLQTTIFIEDEFE